ncbi:MULTISPECIES: head-tail connector protein [unclassified Granulicatella]|uniref:head-tail connector protein n=1 Tax=unclassified Granulicatella TaxID=2630493 RepID=UPI0010741755|nr:MULTISPECIES: head-tail connector protein [unclassified Granulicatella]MBF0780509.1 phage gp6-like head-tail connector protein [Granulicatella sp. 19428wC4_WM01]TFU95324.1 phage gp6-like head-tail connector protein [Granulicatella sp. WM01]
MMRKVTQELVSVEDVLIAQKYEEDEAPFIQSLIDGAVAFLQGAGAYHEDNELTITAIHLMVGNWLENRALDYREYKNTHMFPIGIQAIITQLQYAE